MNEDRRAMVEYAAMAALGADEYGRAMDRRPDPGQWSEEAWSGRAAERADRAVALFRERFDRAPGEGDGTSKTGAPARGG